MAWAQLLDGAFVLGAVGWAVWTMVQAFGLVGRKPKAPTCAHCPVRRRGGLQPAAEAPGAPTPVAHWAKK